MGTTYIVSNNWKYTVKIKHLLDDDDTQEKIIELCNALIPQLKKLNEKVESSNIVEDEIYYITSELEEIIGNFEFLKSLADGDISEDDWGDYDFHGDFQGRFNEYLSMLYDLGDRRVFTTRGFNEKFLWVG